MDVKDRFHDRYFGPQGIISGIRVCIHRQHMWSALSLLCAAIESMVFLGLPDDFDVVNTHDFIVWVNNYMRPQRMGISARDLWQLRCTLLDEQFSHDNTNNDRQRKILFAWGRYSVFDGMELHPNSKWHRIMMIYAEEIYKSLLSGAEQFCSSYVSNPTNAFIVGRRLNQVFGQAKPSSVD